MTTTLPQAHEKARRTPEGFLEFRIAFSHPLTNAARVPNDAALPPVRLPQPKAPPQSATQNTPAQPASATTPAPAEDARNLHDEMMRQMQEDRTQTQAALAALRSATTEVRQQFGIHIEEFQAAAIELALTVATRLLHERVVENNYAIEEIVRDMVGQLIDDTPVAIRMNPKDVELLERRLGGEPLLSGTNDPRLIADATLRRGECNVEGRSSIIMTDVARLLGEIRTEMLRSLGNARS